MAAVAAEGKRRRDKELSLHESEHAAFILIARRKLLELVLERTVTIDDVRAVITIPAGCSPKVLGAVPGGLAHAGLIQRSGYQQTDRAVAHSRPVSVWSVRDAAAVRRWLLDHPAPVRVVGPLVQKSLFGRGE